MAAGRRFVGKAYFIDGLLLDKRNPSSLQQSEPCEGYAMKRRMNLGEAAPLFGLTINGLRARAKKSPVEYGLERDNEGRLWVNLDPDALPGVSTVKPSRTVQGEALHGDVEGVVKVLETALADLRQDRDHWRAMAETLAKRRRWWFWG